MKCENCQKNPATFHYVERQNDQIVKDVHLCEECTRQKGIQHMQFSLSSVLGQLMSPQAMGGSQVAKEMADVACPRCGITYLEFRQKARLGCAQDYDVFRKALLPLLEKIHGNAQHKGKVPPSGGSARMLKHKELFDLRRELERQIKAEHYEEAARIRDRIRQLEVEDDTTTPNPEENLP
jgi:protein arginine kinase activator